MADDPAVSAVALAVDLVAEYDGDESYPDAVLAAARSTSKPVVVLSNLSSAIDESTAARIRAGGVPVLEGRAADCGPCATSSDGPPVTGGPLRRPRDPIDPASARTPLAAPSGGGDSPGSGSQGGVGAAGRLRRP